MNLICPMSSSQLKEWLHEEVFRPYIEGAERINRAWKGIDFQNIYQPKLSLKQRVISLFVGLSLLIPFFNAFIWKSWETFGNPEILSGPYRLPNSPPPSPLSSSSRESPSLESIDPLPPVAPVSFIPSSQSEHLHYDEKEGDYAFSSDWALVPTIEEIETIKTCPHNKVRAIYSKDWLLREYDYTSTDQTQRFYAHLKGRKLVITGTRDGQTKTKTCELTKNYPWVQQATLGFREFIKSENIKLPFYGIDPTDFSLSHLVARKIQIEPSGVRKGLQKVEIRLMGFRSFFWKADVWFDPKTGILREMSHNSGPATPMNTTRFVSAICRDKEAE